MLKLQTPNHEDKVLLHSCCAPCSSAIIECLLANGIRPTVFITTPISTLRPNMKSGNPRPSVMFRG